MKLFALTLILILPLFSLAQAPDKGTLKYLDYKRGFKDIVLGSDISQISTKLKLLRDKKDGTIVYDYVDPENKKVGDVGIDGTVVVTWKGKIIEIMVFFDIGTGLKIDEILTQAYGRYSEKPNQFMLKYNWDSVDVKLILDYDDSSKKPTAFFMDKLLMAKQSKEEKDNAGKAVDEL